ncbi:tRNA uridine-5-carboxymethylaminomethyl(34) synthesis GTPase MnmE [Litorivicinus sp.]|nr:tRNA uridine-5-carboxymethylaminomethyl(34) synthesis GTPase MnmE [Litorivicinus sp.]
MSISDTIVASATAPGRGAISIIRLSGDNSLRIAEALAGKTFTPRLATFGKLISDGLLIDTGVWIYFKGPNSFTGEDVVEFQGHGGPVVIQTILRTTIAQGARLANPGEFSQRAFLNNRIDLTQAEAISDLINATSVSAVKAANQSLSGEFANRIHAIVADLIRLRTQIEAHIDFPDEDIDPQNLREFSDQLTNLHHHLQSLKLAANEGARLNRASDVVLIGEPNVGKSSLLNALANEPLAIVTNIPGTTRDLIRHDLLLDGIELRVTDTAGIRATEDVIETEGIQRARNAIETADIALCLFDERHHTITESLVNRLIGDTTSAAIGIIRTKNDIQSQPTINQTNYQLIEISAVSGSGLNQLKDWLLNELNLNSNAETPFLARERHVIQLAIALNYLHQAMSQPVNLETIDLLAEDLRLTQNALSEITGSFTSDDLLGSIFSTFCIGK